ncbi:GntR family transcriptional regulator [Sphingomonas metalli]|uniref:GntR family transcriptional regulator n=2 Tax=Sphingomonas metalli TaxID=1779358 RepID=A0A916WZJ5_9SPHN|nr:GntR family transcriptional regulator [Sphingomonas metalli]
MIATAEKGEDRLHQMVLKALRTEILRGLHPVGAALPSEATLVARFGVSRHTVREALRQLRELGLVEPRQGFGTVVTQQGGPQPYVHRVSSISDLHDFGVESRYFGDSATLIKTPPSVAPHLHATDAQSWLRIDGLRYAPGDDVPLCEVEIFVAAQFAGVGRLLGKQSGPIYALIELIYGESIGDVEQFVRAFKLEAPSHALKLPAGETVIEIRRVYHTLDGDTAEVTFNRYPADRFSMSMHLRRMKA